MPRALRCVAAVVLAAGALPVLAASAGSAGEPHSPSPQQALAAAATASRTTNFQGVLLYRSGSTMEVMQVVHRFRNNEESEHLLTLTGDPRELIRQGDRLTCILPKDRRLTLERPAMKSFLTRLDGPVIAQLAQWYQFRDLGVTRVAGRECMGVAVQPRDGYRYGYEVWIDRDNHLPLRVILRGEDAHVLEQVMFTEIEFPAKIPDSAFQPQMPPSPGYKILTQQLPDDGPPPTQHIVSDDYWRFGKLPPGFQMTLHDQRDMPDGVGRVDHMLISDGLSSVSVFAARLNASDTGFNGLSRMGAVHAYGRQLDGYQVTVVGEAPSRTVQMIGDAIAPRHDTAPAASSSP